MNTVKKVLNKINIIHNKKLGIIKVYGNREFSRLLGAKDDYISMCLHREKIPYKTIIDFCIKEDLDLNYVFEDN